MFRIQRAAKRTSNCSRKAHQLRALSTQVAPAGEPVKYPEILDLSPRAEHRRQQEIYFDKFKKLGIVEEKLLALNLPKFYGWPSFILREDGTIPYNFLPFSQFVTRTVIRENKRLPSRLSADALNALKERVKQELEKVIVFEKTNVRHKHETERLYMEEEDLPFYDAETDNDLKTRRLVKQMNSVIMRVLASDYPHLISTQLDLDPRVEAFWRVGGFHSTAQDRKLRKDKEVPECMIEDPIDRFIQYFGSPILQLRSKTPLELLSRVLANETVSETTQQSELTTEGVEENTKAERRREVARITERTNRNYYPWQEYRYSPDLYMEILRERTHGGIVPGFWPNDPYRFGIVSYHSTSHFLNRPAYYGSEEHIEANYSQAILASYAWAYGQACYHGFTTYNDITYPFVTQTILTNGKLFSFYQYQLNTIIMHSDHNEANNPLFNECHATPPTELYHEVDGDCVKGWNDDAILNLVTIYTKEMRDTSEMSLFPYLDQNCKFASQIADDERRNWLHNIHRHLTSHRPRHRLAPEIYDWERIFKIEHLVRVRDARKKFFEKFEDPINDRTLNDHVPVYIKKNDRVTRKEKYKKSFYPDVFPTYPEIV